MSERYMIATALEGKIVDYGWCSNWTSADLIMASLLFAAEYDGVTSVRELYSRMGVNEKYEDRREVLEDVITWPDELIVVDLDARNVYFNAIPESPYDPRKYLCWPIADKRAIHSTVKNTDPWDYGWGSGCCRNHRMPFDDFDHEQLKRYCYEYLGWKLSRASSANELQEESDEIEDMNIYSDYFDYDDE